MFSEIAFNECVAQIQRMPNRRGFVEVLKTNDNSTRVVKINNKVFLELTGRDIIKEPADVLVNTANSQLFFDGGLA